MYITQRGDGEESVVVVHIENKKANPTDPKDSEELWWILCKHFPAWAGLFARKNSEYGSGSAFELGERGQFSDMYRKMIKLKRAMWDEDESVLTTEGVDEILMDLIGHCFLTLEMRRRSKEADAEPDEEDNTPMTPLGSIWSPVESMFANNAPNPAKAVKLGDIVQMKGEGQWYRVEPGDDQDHWYLIPVAQGSLTSVDGRHRGWRVPRNTDDLVRVDL